MAQQAICTARQRHATLPTPPEVAIRIAVGSLQEGLRITGLLDQAVKAGELPGIHLTFQTCTVSAMPPPPPARRVYP